MKKKIPFKFISVYALVAALTISCIGFTKGELTTTYADDLTTSDTSLAASIEIPELIADWTFNGYTNFYGHPVCNIPSDYKYMQIICSGDDNALAPLRFMMFALPYVDNGTYTFDSTSTMYKHFVTPEGTAIPALGSDKQVIIIDLEASGVELSGGCAGFHILYDIPAGVTETNLTIHDARFLLTSDPIIPPEIDINGFQISSSVGGFRTIYSVTDTTYDIASVGLIYGLDDYADEDDMIIDSDNEYVYQFASTDEGAYTSPVKGYSESYAMTMEFGNVSPEFFNANTLVRAYIQLADGEYIYSDIESYTVYAVADVLYKNSNMSSATKHQFLYNRILGYVNPTYEQIEYNNSNTLLYVNN